MAPWSIEAIRDLDFCQRPLIVVHADEHDGASEAGVNRESVHAVTNTIGVVLLTYQNIDGTDGTERVTDQGRSPLEHIPRSDHDLVEPIILLDIGQCSHRSRIQYIGRASTLLGISTDVYIDFPCSLFVAPTQLVFPNLVSIEFDHTHHHRNDPRSIRQHSHTKITGSIECSTMAPFDHEKGVLGRGLIGRRWYLLCWVVLGWVGWRWAVGWVG